MKRNKLILAGGSGYLGTVLADFFSAQFNEIVILSRTPKPLRNNVRTALWDASNEGPWTNELEGAEVIVNLTGKNVNCRYNEANKKEILLSRTVSTALLGRVIDKLKNKPALWVNCMSATIYRHSEDKPMDETTGEFGTGFSVDVCQAWEKSFVEAIVPGVRKAGLRISFVVGNGDGAFPRLHNLVKYGLGGRQGSGKQMVSWIHETDFARIIEWVMNNPHATGIYNCTAPQPVTNAEMMRALRKAAGAPFGLPAYKWVLEVGALFIQTETELILKSRWVLPKRLQKEGFDFMYSEINKAFRHLLKG